MSIIMNTFLFLLLSVTLVVCENKLNCFDDKDNYVCEKNRIKINSEYHECKVITTLDSVPTKMTYNQENSRVYMLMDGKTYRYELKANNITSVKYRWSKALKSFLHNGKEFEESRGKALVRFSDDSEYDVLTLDENTSDHIDLHLGSNTLFILSHKYNKTKKENFGALYTLDAENVPKSEGIAITEKVGDIDAQISSMAINTEENALLLTTHHKRGGKLVSVSMVPSNPCDKITGRIIPINYGINPGDQNNDEFVQIIKEAELKMNQLLGELLTKYTDSKKGSKKDSGNDKETQKKIDTLTSELEKANNKITQLKSKFGGAKRDKKVLGMYGPPTLVMYPSSFQSASKTIMMDPNNDRIKDTMDFHVSHSDYDAKTKAELFNLEEKLATCMADKLELEGILEDASDFLEGSTTTTENYHSMNVRYPILPSYPPIGSKGPSRGRH